MGLNKKVSLLIKRVMTVIDWQPAVSAILKLPQGIGLRVGECSPTSNIEQFLCLPCLCGKLCDGSLAGSTEDFVSPKTKHVAPNAEYDSACPPRREQSRDQKGQL